MTANRKRPANRHRLSKKLAGKKWLEKMAGKKRLEKKRLGSLYRSLSWGEMLHLDSNRFDVQRGAGPDEPREVSVEVGGRLHLEVFCPLLAAVGHIPSVAHLWPGEMPGTCAKG